MFEHLDTPRLRLRRLAAGDLPVWLDYRNDPEVARYQSWESFTPGEGADFIAAQSLLEPGTPGRWFQFGITVKPDFPLIGDCALHVDPNHVAEIGFTVSRAGLGKGFAAEAVRAVIRYAFRELGVRRVQAIVDDRNSSAVRLLERLGLQPQEHLGRQTWFKDEWSDEHVYAIDRSQCREEPAL